MKIVTKLISSPSFEYKRAVGSPEAKGVGDRDLDLGLAGDVWNVVEIAVRVGEFIIHGGRHHLIVEGEGGVGGLDASGGAKQMPGHGLGGAYGQFVGVVTENGLYRLGLVFVV